MSYMVEANFKGSEKNFFVRLKLGSHDQFGWVENVEERSVDYCNKLHANEGIFWNVEIYFSKIINESYNNLKCLVKIAQLNEHHKST